MKLVLLLAVFATTIFVFTARHSELPGTWIFESNSNSGEVPVLRITMAEGFYKAKLDMPEQQIYDLDVRVYPNEDSVRIVLDESGSCYIMAVVNDSVLSGRSVVEGRSEIVKFRKLTAERPANKIPHPSAPMRAKRE